MWRVMNNLPAMLGLGNMHSSTPRFHLFGYSALVLDKVQFIFDSFGVAHDNVRQTGAVAV